MRIVMTLLVRDEEDIVDEHLRYHLAQGIDFVVATDHGSVDGTTDILRRYERDGRLHLIRDNSSAFRQNELVTRMARLAARDFAADWVIHSDVDEFWWPRDARFDEIFAAVPSRFGLVFGLWRHYVLRPDDARPFFERMLWRRRPVLDWANHYHPTAKIAHRADPDVVVADGNHKAFGRNLTPLRTWLPFELLHFPLRSRAHVERKFRRHDRGRHHVAGRKVVEREGFDGLYTHYLVDDDALARGLADGSLTEDVRVRDTLRGSRDATPFSMADDVAFAVEADTLHPAEAALRLSRRMEHVDRTIGALERR